jgi:hypothetical protein
MSESESLLQFPCDFPIKVVGQGTADFEVEVVARVREHAPDLGEGAVRSRPSQGGKVPRRDRRRARHQPGAARCDLPVADGLGPGADGTVKYKSFLGHGIHGRTRKKGHCESPGKKGSVPFSIYYGGLNSMVDRVEKGTDPFLPFC